MNQTPTLLERFGFDTEYITNETDWTNGEVGTLTLKEVFTHITTSLKGGYWERRHEPTFEAARMLTTGLITVDPKTILAAVPYPLIREFYNEVEREEFLPKQQNELQRLNNRLTELAKLHLQANLPQIDKLRS